MPFKTGNVLSKAFSALLLKSCKVGGFALMTIAYCLVNARLIAPYVKNIVYFSHSHLPSSTETLTLKIFTHFYNYARKHSKWVV